MAERALVLGGTGMLAGVASWLVARGWHVVLPSRRYCPIPADELESSGGPVGKALWVQAHWERPQRLAEAASSALGGNADLLVSWVHGTYRRPVLDSVAGLLTAQAPIVEVVGSVSADPYGAPPDPVLAGHPAHRVVLGYVKEETATRWLTHAEIVEGVLGAVRRAVDARPATLHQVGELRPWPPVH